MPRTWWVKRLFSRRTLPLRRDARPPVRPQVTWLEDRTAPAAFTFNAGTGALTIAFAANDAVTVSDNGTIFAASDGVNGVVEPSGTVTSITATDPGNGGGESLTFLAGTPLALPGGLSSAGVETVTFNDAINTSAAPINVAAPRNIAVNAALTTTAGNITLQANTAGTAAGNFVGLDVNGAAISTAGGNINLTATGGNTGGKNYGVQLQGGATVTGGGAGTTVTVQGTGGASGGGNNFGIWVFGAGTTITSAGGNVSVTGQGGGSGATSVFNVGVMVGNGVLPGGTITAGGSGTVTVNGTGGVANGGSAPDGVGVRLIKGGLITSGGGNVSVTGQGSVTGTPTGDDYGVSLEGLGSGGETITAGGTGTVTVQGTGGAGSISSEFGVFVAGLGSQITSGGGAVVVTGQGGGSGASTGNTGVSVTFGGVITAGATGTVTVQGTGGLNGDGVALNGTGAQVTSGGGNVQVTGQGGSGTAAGAAGVALSILGAITAGGAGTVTVQGTGGAAGGNFNYGVFLADSSVAITSSGGAVSVTGQGGGSGGSGFNSGVFVGGTITAGGTGAVTVQGTGGAGGTGTDNYGVLVAGQITSGGGNVQVTGQGGGSGASTANVGVLVNGGAPITAGGAGTVTVAGTGGVGANSSGVQLNSGTITSAGAAVQVTGNGSAGAAFAVAAGPNSTISSGGSAPLTIVADSLSVDTSANPATIRAGATGNQILTVQPRTSGTTINLGGADVLSGSPLTLGLTNAELGRMAAGVLRVGDFGATGGITVTAAVTAPAGWNTLSLVTSVNGGISQNSGASLTVASLQAAGATGVSLTSANNAVGTLAGAANTGSTFSFTDSTSLTVGSVDTGLGSGFGTGIITGGPVNLTVNAAGGLLTVGQAIDTQHFGGGGAVALTADDMAIAAAVNAGGQQATLAPFTAARVIDLGTDTAGRLGLTDAELDKVTAGALHAGSAANTGGIVVSAPIIQAGSGYTTLSLQTGGAVANTNATGPDVTVANLTVRSAAGIALDTAVSTLAFNNTGGAVNIANTGGVTVNSLDGLATSANTGTTTTLSAASPFVFAVNTTSAGTISVTTTETASESTTPLPPPDDDIVVNAGVTVESTGGDVVLTSGDSIVLQAGSTVKSDTGAVNLTVGVGDVDNDAALVLNGSVVAGTDVSLTAPADICLGSTITAAGTVSITSTGGAILDCNDVPSGTPVLNVSASKLALSASTGIGVTSVTPPINATDAPLETQVGSLEAQTATGGIFVGNTGALAVGGVTGALSGVRVTTSGDIVLTNAGSVSIVTGGEIVKGPGNVTVTATGATSDVQTGGGNNGLSGNGAINAGGTATVTTGRDLLVGQAANFGDIDGGGSVVLNVGRDLILNGNTFIDAHGAGTVTATAGRNITLTLSGDRITSQSGAIALATGAGGVFTDNGTVSSTATGTGAPITVSADDVVINTTTGAVNAGTSPTNSVVTLQQATTTARNVTVGGGAAGLGLSDAELGRVTAAAAVRIGRADNAGNITLDGNVTAHAGYTTLHLITGGAVDQTAGTLTVANLAVEAVAGIGSATPINTVVGKLAAVDAGAAASGNVQFANTGALDVNTVDGVVGVQRTGGALGNVVLTAASPLTINSPVVDNTGGDITETAGAANSNAAADVLTINANVTASGGNGSIFLNGNTLVVNAATVSVANAGNVTGSFGGTGGAATFNNGSVVSAVNGNVNVTATTGVTLNGTATVQTTGAGNITLTADDAAIAATAVVSASDGTANGNNIVTIQNFTASRPIDLGTDTAGTLGLTNAELGRVTAETLRIGRNDAGASGNIAVSAAITPTVGTLSLRTGGGVSQTAGATITVNGGAGSLAVQAVNAVTLGESNHVAVLAGAVTGAGQGFTYTDADALTFGTVDGVSGISTNNGAVTVSTVAGDLAVGNVIVTSGTAPTALTAGGLDSLFSNPNGLVLTSNNTVTVTADRMNLGVAPNGIVTGSGRVVLVEFTASRPINLGSTLDPTGSLNLSDAELDTVTTTGVLQVGDTNAGNVTVSAAINPAKAPTLAIITGGSVTGPGAISVNALRISSVGAVSLPGPGNVATLAANVTGAGNGFTYVDLDALAIGTVDGVNGVTTNNGPIVVRTANGPLTVTDTPAAFDVDAGNSTVLLEAISAGAADNLLTVAGSAGVRGTGGVTLAADNMSISSTAAINAGTAVATLRQSQNGTLINLGGADGANTLGLTDAELDTVTAGVLRVGDANSGNLTVTAVITPAGTNTLSLRSGGAITDTIGSGGGLQVSNLAAVAAGNVDLVSLNNVIGTIAGRSTGGFFSLLDGAPALAVGSVDGTDGVATAGGAVDLYNGATLTVTDTPAANDVDSAGGPVQLVALALTNAAGARVDSGGGTILARADNMDLQAGSALAAGAGRITLQPRAGTTTTFSDGTPITFVTPAVAIDLGGPDVAFTTLGLTNAEVNTALTTGVLQVGGPAAGNITVTAAIAPTTPTTLDLETGGGVAENPGGSITTPNLAVRAVNAVGLGQPNDVTTGQLAASVTGLGQAFTFTDANGLTVGTADGLVGVTTNGGDVTLNTGGTIAITQNVTTGGTAAGTVTLNPSAGGVTESAGVGVTAKNLLLTGAGTFTLNQTNNVAVLAANTSGGAIVYKDADALAVGTVGATVGITTAGQDLTVCNVSVGSPANDLVVNSAINVGTGTARLDSAASVTEAAGVAITAGTLGVRADGNISLIGPNAAPLVALQAGGSVVYNSAGPFNQTVVPASDCFRGAAGISSFGDITLCQATGDLVVASPLAVSAANTIRLEADGGGVTQTAAGTLTAGNLGVVAKGGDIALDLATNTITNQFAASDTAAGKAIRFTDSTGFTVGAVPAATCFGGAAGAQANGGPVTLTVNAADGLLTNANAVVGSSALLTADRMALAGGTVNVGTGAANIVTLQPLSAGRLIDVGSATDAAANTLELSDAELDTITAGVLRIGKADAGNVTVTAAIDAPAGGYAALHLFTPAAVAEAAGGTLTVPNLAVGGVDVALTNANKVGTLAGAAGDGSFAFTNAQDLTIGVVDGIVGVTASRTAAPTADVTLTVTPAGGLLTINNPVTAADVVNLTADRMAVNAAVTAGAQVNVRQASAAWNIDLGSTLDTTANTLELSNAELNRLATPTVVVGNPANTGTITVVAPGPNADSPVSVAPNLVLTTAGPITVNAGLASTGGALRLTNGGTLSLNAVTVSGKSAVTQDGAGPVVLTGDAVVVSSAGPVSFASPIDATTAGGQALTVVANTTATLSQSAGATTRLKGLAVTGAAIHLNGASYKTTGDQAYAGPVTVSAPAVLFDSSAGNITFGAALDAAAAGGTPVTVTAAGTVAFLGPVGGAAAPASLAVTAAVIDVNGGLVRTTGAQTFNGAVVLSADATFASLAGGDVTFNGTVDGPGGATVNTAGVTRFLGAVGNATPLAFVATDAAGSTQVGGQLVRTAGAQTYNDPVSVVVAGANFVSTGGGDITFNNTLTSALNVGVSTAGLIHFNAPVSVGVLVTSGGGRTEVNTGTVTTTGLQLFAEPVDVLQDVTFASTGGGNVTFASTLDGAHAVAVNTAGVTAFDGPVGGATALASLTTDAPGTTDVNGGLVRTTGAQTFNDPVVLTANTTFVSTAGGNVVFGQTLFGPFSATVNTAGTSAFNGNVALASLTTDAPGVTAVNAPSVATTGAQTFNDGVVVGTNVTFASTGGGNVTFNSALTGPFAVTVDTAGTTTFAGPVNVGSLTTDTAGTTDVNGGSVTTAGVMLFGDPVTVTQDTTFTATTPSAGSIRIDFASTLDGAHAVTVNVGQGAVILFGGAVGGAVPLASLTVNTLGIAAVAGGLVRTTGNQTFNGNVLVQADATFDSTAAGNISFNGFLFNAFPVAVTVTTAGTTAFNDNVALGSLTTDAPGVTTVHAPSIATSGSQTFNDGVTVGTDVTFTSTGGGNVTFANTLGGGFSVTVNTAGTTAFLGAVNLAGLTTDAAGTTDVNGGSVTTTGGQTYNDPVVLTADTTFTSTGGGNVTFANTLSGPFAATVNTAGTTTFGGRVNIAGLTTDAPGNTVVNTDQVTTSGSQTFNDGVTVQRDVTFRSTGGGDVTFANTLSGPFAVLAATGGTTTFDGAVSLGSLTTDAGGRTVVRTGTVTTTGDQTYGDDLSVETAGTTLTAHAITFNGNVAATGDLVLNPQGGPVTENGPSLVAPTLGLTGNGDFNLDQLGNDVRNTVRINIGTGTVRLADGNDLTVDQAGVVIGTGDLFVRTGGNFTVQDARKGADKFSTPLVQVGGRVDVDPGLSGGSVVVVFDAEARVTGSGDNPGIRLGVPGGHNNKADVFTVRPSASTRIQVYGNLPVNPLPAGVAGDVLNPILTGVTVTQFANDGENGFYLFTDRSKLEFFSIESLQQLSAAAYVVQTREAGDALGSTATEYQVRVVRTQQGVVLGAPVDVQFPAQNVFVVSPTFVNSAGSTGAGRVAIGDVNGDGTPDVILANGPGQAPIIVVVDGRDLKTVMSQFYAYDPAFFGGVNVGVGDIDGDGRAEIVTGAEAGGGPHVRVFSMQDAGGGKLNPVQFGDATGTFFAYETAFTGGVRVAVGDVNGDGHADLILGTGVSGGPRVRVIDGKEFSAQQANGVFAQLAPDQVGLLDARVAADGALEQADFFAYDTAFRGGIFVAAGDYNNDGKADILTGAGFGGGPDVRVFDGGTVNRLAAPTQLAGFFAYAPTDGNPLIGSAGQLTGVGGVAFGIAGTGGTTRNILVSTPRGRKVQVVEFDGAGQSRDLLRASNVAAGTDLPAENIPLLQKVKGSAPVFDPNDPNALDPDLIMYGATVGGFVQT